jgi:hypothetical protein
MPVRAKDFSQSAVEDPRMFPSVRAKPGQRVQVEPCAHCEQPDRSFKRIDRTSFGCSESRQMSMKRCARCHRTRGIARRDKTRRKAKCSKQCGPRCKARILGFRHRPGAAARKIRPRCHEHFVTEKFMEGGIAWIQLQNRAVPIHHGTDRRVQCARRAPVRSAASLALHTGVNLWSKPS